MTTEAWTFLPDRDDLAALTDDGKIEWLEGRVHRILITPLREMRRLGRGTLQGNPDPAATFWSLPIVTLICSGVEALGHHLHGRKAVRSGSVRDFQEFIDTFMPDYAPVKEEIYNDFRSGLAHALVPRRGSVEERLGRPYLRDRRGLLRLDLDRFFQAFVVAVENYFAALRENADLKRRFVDRFNVSNRFWIENPPRGAR
ncbi:MAG TPA: hypothetical protein VFT43_06405 [Candidatus Polarisedimenticolia bacterium]|nr:hypothetical protein [Candidatus Polarisedimenticolia bacterium]